jgi:bile acid-coenzyme A ligase
MSMVAIAEVPWWHANRHPQAVAVMHGAAPLTWLQLAQAATRKARALESFGVQVDDRVAISLPNGNDFFEAVFAVWMTGATPVPISARLPAPEIRALMDLASPSAIIASEAIEPPGLRVLPSDWASRSNDESPLPAKVSAHWKIIASGGSTGRPKLIVDSAPALTDPSRYMFFDQGTYKDRLGRPNGVFLNPGPLYHNGPFAFSFMNLFSGSTVVGMVRFDPEEMLRLIEAHRVEFAYMVPTMMHRIWKLPAQARTRYDLSSLKAIMHVGAPCPDWLKRRWIEWLGADRVWEAYGSTESIARTMIDGNQWLERPGSVGRFQDGAEGQILDPEGAALPPGQIGELWVKAPPGRAPTYSYIGAQPKRQADWESIGDLASMDEDGFVYLSDRRNDLILRAGVNIYPSEIEAAIDAHPDVLSCAVVGLPDGDLGSRVLGIVQLRAEARNHTNANDLLAFLKTRVSSYKVPAAIEFVEHSLRDDAGKVRRAELMKMRAKLAIGPELGPA